MYSWVVPPALLGRLARIRETKRIPIARQIREAVQDYLSRVEDAAIPDEPRTLKGGESP